MRGIVRDSVAEMLDRKVFWLFAGMTVLAMLMAAMSRSIDVHIQTSDPAFDVAAQQIQVIAIRTLSAYIAFLVFLAVMASAAVIPSMLERGRADYYLSKPISRGKLLLSKLTAVWVVYGCIIVISSLLAYSMAGLVHHMFEPKVLLLLSLAGAQLLVWLCITFAAGIFTGSTSMAIVTAFLVWIFQLILVGREGLKNFFDSAIASAVIDGLYYVVPKTSQMADIGLSLAITDEVTTWMPLWSSLLTAAVILYVSYLYLRQKDY